MSKITSIRCYIILHGNKEVVKNICHSYCGQKNTTCHFSGEKKDHTGEIAKEHNKEKNQECDSVSDYICKGNCEIN